MTFIRSLLFNVLFFGCTTILAILSIPTIFFGKSAVSQILKLWLVVIYQFEKYILNLTYTVKGSENLPSGSYIVAAKHQSAWETMKLHLIFNDPAVVLKKGLEDIPFWGRYSKVMGMIPVDRSRGSEAIKTMMERAYRVRDEGRPIVIFPQGTRVAVGDKRPYKTGVMRMYEELNIPIVPVALNSGVFWPRNSFIKKPGTITVEILPSIPTGQESEAVRKQIEEQIEHASDRLAQEVSSHEG